MPSAFSCCGLRLLASRFAAARRRTHPQAPVSQRKQCTHHHDESPVPYQCHIGLPPDTDDDRSVSRFVAKREIDLAEPYRLDARFSCRHLASREKPLGRFDLSKTARAGIEQRESTAIFGEVGASQRAQAFKAQRVILYPGGIARTHDQ